jgi:hypothetical protein
MGWDPRPGEQSDHAECQRAASASSNTLTKDCDSRPFVSRVARNDDDFRAPRPPAMMIFQCLCCEVKKDSHADPLALQARV